MHADLLEHYNVETFVAGIGFAVQGLECFKNYRFELSCGGLFSDCLGCFGLSSSGLKEG